jgi:ribosomal protein S18 acetylase RimI-like enzyme
MNLVHVRRLGHDDVAIARQLADELLGAPNVPPEELARLLVDDRCIVLAAFAGDRAVAYLVAYCFPSLSGDRLAYLYDIEVHHDMRRQGIGRRLASELKKLCRTLHVSSIWVGSSLTNVAACALWASTGGERVSEQFVEYTYEL